MGSGPSLIFNLFITKNLHRNYNTCTRQTIIYFTQIRKNENSYKLQFPLYQYLESHFIENSN